MKKAITLTISTDLIDIIRKTKNEDISLSSAVEEVISCVRDDRLIQILSSARKSLAEDKAIMMFEVPKDLLKDRNKFFEFMMLKIQAFTNQQFSEVKAENKNVE